MRASIPVRAMHSWKRPSAICLRCTLRRNPQPGCARGDAGSSRFTCGLDSRSSKCASVCNKAFRARSTFFSSKRRFAGASCCSKSRRSRCVRCAIPEAALAAALTISPCAAQADLLPLWEAGIGIAPIDFPDYPGSNQRSFYALPLPYFVYRGEQLKVGREGIRERFFQSDRVELDLSASASVPVKSENNEARAGMPDLDPTFQLGPALDIKLHEDDQHKLKLRLPARFAFATDFTYVK